MSVDWQGIGIVVGALAGSGGFAAVLNSRRPKGERENALIDQYQEHAKEQDTRIERLESRVDASVERERVRDDYIMVLRAHIAEGKPPPPPPFPPALLGGGR